MLYFLIKCLYTKMLTSILKKIDNLKFNKKGQYLHERNRFLGSQMEYWNEYLLEFKFKHAAQPHKNFNS